MSLTSRTLFAGIVVSVAISSACSTTPADPSTERPAAAAGPATFLIAHRGASAYAPEHTMAAYRLAIEQGADYIEPDLGITKDGVLVATHDTYLERTTNVRDLFPGRYSDVAVDGGKISRHWLVEDLTLAEVKQLDAGSWFDPKFAGEKMVTFQEVIDLAKTSHVGLFPELKTPGRFHQKGFDPEQLVAETLEKNHLIDATVNGRPAVQLQVGEEGSLRRLATLLPTMKRHLLVGTADQVERYVATPEALAEVKTYATGIAPAYQILDRMPDLAATAHAAGLTVVPYTFALRPPKNDYPDAPPEIQALIEETMKVMPATRDELAAQMRRFVERYEVDGLFTNNPDLFERER